MKKLKLDEKKIESWKENYYQYASEYVRRGSGTDRERLRFSINLSGQYRVVLGTRVIYQGTAIMLAIQAYNDA